MSKWLARFDARNLYTSGVPKVPKVAEPFARVECITAHAISRAEIAVDPNDLAEREAMALEGGVHATFARAFAVLQLAQPACMDVDGWHRAINDAGLLLDVWGQEAERLGWAAHELIGPGPHALAWALDGARVVAITTDGAKFEGGRNFFRDSNQAGDNNRMREEIPEHQRIHKTRSRPDLKQMAGCGTLSPVYSGSYDAKASDLH